VTEHLLAIGTRKGLFLARSDDGRATWQLDGPHFPSNDVYSVAIDTRRDPMRILAGAHSEHWGPTVFRSDDVGASWQETEGGAVRFPVESGGVLHRIWQLLPGPAGQPDTVWAGCEPASLFRSDDGGLTFALVEGLWDHPHRPKWEPGGGGLCLHTVVLHPSDPDLVLVAISSAGVYRSRDRGRTWAPSNTGIAAGFFPDPHPEYGQCVHKVAAQADHAGQLFLQNHGGVYRSDDGGDSWSPIEHGLPSVFGFPIVAHPHRPGTAYVYPLVSDEHRIPPEGSSRVYRTEDAGASWQPLSTGLPQENVYGTVLRDAMTVDDATPAGVYFGTRNGAVFASRDEGDSWASVATYLPDVLVVRAATITR
jgi:photosystem II stability/assembly factor-like uncharacterized protein